DDLKDLVGDGSLTGSVIHQFQFFEQVTGILCCLVHGSHSRAVLRSITFQDSLEKLGSQRLWHELFDDKFTGWLEDIVGLGSGNLVLNRCKRQKLLCTDDLSSHVFELVEY